MIFVSVGNANQGFERLLVAIEALAGKGFFEDNVVMIQSGNNPGFQPVHCKYRPFFTIDEFIITITKAILIICHAGAGTLFHILREGKVPVVMPRQKRYAEHVDDHQVELTKALAAEGRVIPAYEPEDLPAAIEEARRRNTQPIPPPPSRTLELIAQAIEELLNQRKYP